MRAAIYCRISDDKEGEQIGVGRQEADCRELAQSTGCSGVEVFIDNDLGASSRSRAKRRPEYERMLSAVRRQDFDVILSYSNSRLTRRLRELEDLIQLHEQTKVLIKTVVSGNDDLSTADGRMVARIKASVDAGEVERTAERVARAHLENARNGKPVGGFRPFGWLDDKATLHPVEAPLVREAASRVLAGDSSSSIIRAWNQAGVLTTAGKPWKGATFRQYMKNPRLIGHRTYQRKVLLDGQGQPVRGQWEPMLDEGTWLAIVQLFTKPEGRIRSPRRDRRRYLLTGLARCGVCNGPMYGNVYTNNGVGHYYTCSDGHTSAKPHTVSASGRSVDALVTELALAKLAQMREREPDEASWPEEARYAELEQAITATLEQLGKSGISPERIFAQVERMEAELGELRPQREDWLARQAVPIKTKLTPSDWDRLEPERRRGHIASVLSCVYIMPATRRTGSRFDPDRVVPAWREDL